MKIATWNVGGLRACIKKGFLEFMSATDADVVLIQETHINEPIPEIEDLSKIRYASAYSFANRKGYSGTLCLFRKKPKKIQVGLGVPALDDEGRVITLIYEDFCIVNAYVPNSTANLARRYYRADWDKAFREYISGLAERQPVIIGGDFNVARSYIDVFPENLRNEKNPSGFESEERDNLEKLLNSGFVDVYRHFYPDKEGVYTWWSNRLNKRLENRGWRIDYFFVSEAIITDVRGIEILSDIQGSDHCPIELSIEI